MTEPLTVQDAIARVIGDLPNIGKGDKSPEGYQYRGIEAVTKHVQPLFAKYGVVIAPSAEITDVRPSPAMKEGWTDVFIRVAWTITGPDGSAIQAQTTGIGRDRADKGANKAQTQAYKYLLLHLLCIADGKDDSDNQTYEHDRQERRDEPQVLAGWSSLEEQDEAHHDLKSEISEQSPDVQASMREFRKDRRFGWPMSAEELGVMRAEMFRLRDAEIDGGGAPDREAGGGTEPDASAGSVGTPPSSELASRAKAMADKTSTGMDGKLEGARG